jgi:hypothetical protein
MESRKPEAVNESYFDDLNTWRWYCIVNGADYTGIGHYDNAELVKNEKGEEYIIGAGTTIE